MKRTLKKFAESLWSRPDPALTGAGAAGELLVAKIRLGLASVLLLIPLIDTFMFEVERQEAIVGLSLAAGTFLFSAGVYLLAIREFTPPWLGFVSSSYDITQVSAALAVFLFLNQPHTAVNSRVVFEGYFLAIGSASLRYDRRICVTAGLLAIGEYFAINLYAATKWDLNSAAFSPFPYGMFSWTSTISRMVMLLTAAILGLAFVARSQKLLHMATIDPLTGLLNRRYVDDRFALELSRARRNGQPLSIAVIDVDRFKLFNDTHGHSAGDLALKAIGATLRSSFRQSDTTGRYGGEEFVVIMPETGLEAAQQKLEYLRTQIANTSIDLKARGVVVNVTISAGLAAFPQDGADETELFTAADERLFQAKREGRNRTVASPIPAVLESVLA
jgi:diguanylate cyclase (GGDEF)-like protein